MHILTFSSLYPSQVDPSHGIFVERRLRELTEKTDVSATVVAPVPWFPFRSKRFGRYAEFASIPRLDRRHGIEIHYPRFPVVPKVGMLAAPGMMARGTSSTVEKVWRQHGRIDLIDAHYFYPDGVAAARIARRTGTPVIVTARGSDINLIASMKRPRQMILEAASIASAVVAVSEALAERMAEIGIDRRKIHVLRNGVDLDFFEPGDRAAARQRLGITEPTMISVGALKEAKGHHVAIDALVELPGTNLIVIGAGEYEMSLRKRVADTKLDERVTFAGRLSADALRVYYQAADALCLASRREGMPNVVLESVACGTPVIATDVGGIREVIEPGVMGELLRDRSATGVARAWRKIHTEGLDRRAIRRSAEAFSWDATVRRLHDLMLSCARQ